MTIPRCLNNIGEFCFIYFLTLSLIFDILAIIAAVILSKSTFGRKVYAIGTNRLAARYSGVAVQKIRFIIYTVMGTAAGLCALFMVATSYGANTTTGTGFEMDAIAMAVFGGISSTGGKGNMIGTVFGAVLMTTISNGLSMLNVSTYWHQVVIGAFILFAVAFDYFATSRERSKDSLKG